MDSLAIIAAAGMRARLETLDLLANNLANSSTPGFKADRESYSTYLAEEALAASQNGFGNLPAIQPVIERHRTDLTQGQLQTTGSSLDLALEGRGFFLTDGPTGPLLTRNGRYNITRDGKIVTPEGYEFATVEPRRIRADPSLPVEVGPDGTVSQQGAPLGRLRVVDAPDDPGLMKKDGAYFLLDSTRIPNLKPATAEVHQGRLEASNFSTAEAAVKLIGVLRQFEALQKALQAGGEMGRKVVEEVARVNP